MPPGIIHFTCLAGQLTAAGVQFNICHTGSINALKESSSYSPIDMNNLTFLSFLCAHTGFLCNEGILVALQVFCFFGLTSKSSDNLAKLFPACQPWVSFTLRHNLCLHISSVMLVSTALEVSDLDFDTSPRTPDDTESWVSRKIPMICSAL